MAIMRLASACAAAATLAAWPSVAFAGDPAAAREQLKIGYQLAEEGKCEEAIPHLAESLRLDARAITLINLADCEEKVGKWTDSLAHWVDARSRAQTESAKKIEEEAALRAAALEPRFPRLTLVLAKTAPADAVVERDGVVLGKPSLGLPLPVDPGAHAIVVKAPGHADATTNLTLAEGEAKKLDLDVGAVVAVAVAPPPAVATAPEPKPGRSPLVYAGFGGAAAGLVVGSVTGLMAIGAGNDAETACPNRRCSRAALDDVESGRTMGTISTVAFVVAGACLAVGLYGLLKPPARKTAAIERVLQLGGAF